MRQRLFPRPRVARYHAWETMGMKMLLSRRQILAWMSLTAFAPRVVHAALAGADTKVRHPPGSIYELEFGYPIDHLVGDLQHSERGDPRHESSLPHSEWYTTRSRYRYGSWGPKPRTYPVLPGLEQKPVDWKRQRVVATAARFIGYGYQHHHIPDWNPPASWPWKETCAGHNGKGVDCSNLTSFVYNQGFGIRMSSAIGRQSHAQSALESDGYAVPLRQVDLPRDYEQRCSVLHTGDLVYIRGREHGPVTHVVIWVGGVGRSDSGVPLVLDSHGSGVRDDEDRVIPCGVQLRPFRKGSWYDRCASHAHRMFHGSEI